MIRRCCLATIALLALVAAPAHAAEAPGKDDVTVVAVIDSGVNPYHWDFAAEQQPQHLDRNKKNDLPLTQGGWIPGMRESFDSFQALPLSHAANGDALASELAEQDGATLAGVTPSAGDEVHGYYIPGTKVVGAVSFDDQGELFKGADAHGAGVASSVAGSLHGTCPECVLVFIDKGENAADGEAAINWAMDQPWIDVITNSYGYATVYRERVYSGSDVERQRGASQRGQTVFFSSGNGQENAFTVPNTTTFSSQEGPDWIVTVGAVSPGEDNYYGTFPTGGQHGQYLGSGKPADIAGIGLDYPTAYGADQVSATGETGFSGTSNATPQVAGYYARALGVARTLLGGPSRTQSGGVVATGKPVACGAARPDCELGDGKLTVDELRTRLFHGAIPTYAGTTTFVGGEIPLVADEQMLSQGHGAYFGRESADRDAWFAEFDRIVAPMEGRVAPLRRPDGEREWMVVDSFCRQQMWGAWDGGYYRDGETELPGPDPRYPIRSAYEQTCPGGPL